MKKSFSFFRVSLRLWRRHAAGVLVAMLGLACAFGFTLLAAVQLYDGMSSDKWLKNSDRLYRLNEQWLMNGQKGVFGVGSGTVLHAGPLVRDNTADIEALTRLFPLVGETTLRREGDDTDFKIQASMQAESNLADVLDFPVLRGDLTTALQDAGNMILTARQASRLFGEEDPIGQTVTLGFKEQTQAYKVAAVMADIPPNSHFAIDLLIPWNEPFMQMEQYGMGTGQQTYTYFKVKPGTDSSALNTHIKDTISPMLPPSGNIIIELSTDPVAGSLYGGKAVNYMKPNVEKRLSTIQLVMASVLLLAAGFNFIHVFTSINLGRGREVAVRRISGASRWHLAGVFLMEAGFLVLAAFGIGLLAAHDLSIYATEFGANEVLLLHPSHMPVLLATAMIALLIGLLAATAMLAQISRMTPQSLLHRSQRAITGGGDRLKRILVGLQAMALVGSLIAAVQVYYQFDHFLTMDRGMRVEGVLIIHPPFEEKESARFKNDFRQELEALPGVQQIAQISGPPFRNNVTLFNLRGPGQELPQETIVRDVGTDYFDLFQINPILTSGEKVEGQKNAIALPERSLAAFGFASVDDAIDSHLTSEWKNKDGGIHTEHFRIMAVVPDVKDDPNSRKQPLVYQMSKFYDNWHVTLVAIADQKNDTVKEHASALWVKHFPDYEKDLSVRWFTDLIADRYATTRSTAYVLAGMGVFCLMLCFASLYGMANHYAITKAREIALRRVLGAGRRDIGRLFLARLLSPVLVGGLLVMVPTWWLMHQWIASYREQALLPLPVYGLVLIVVMVVSALILASHVRRILGLRPASVLYHE